MMESDNAAEKAVAARPMTLAQSVNAWMNLGRRLFKAIMEIWKPIADLPLRIMVKALAPKSLASPRMGGAEAEWNSLNDRNIKLMLEFNRISPKSSGFILNRTKFSDKSIREVVIAIPLPIMKKHGLHMGQSIGGNQASRS